jgi:hypothetical protein
VENHIEGMCLTEFSKKEKLTNIKTLHIWCMKSVHGNSESVLSHRHPNIPELFLLSRQTWLKNLRMSSSGMLCHVALLRINV